MSRKWKPGEYALVTGPSRMLTMGTANPENVTTLCRRTDEVWLAVGLPDRRGFTDREVVEIRPAPLVVLDPEDAEAVERLSSLLWPHYDGNRLAHLRKAEVTADALREFANPTPPKPDEPTGLGAVVEDEDGVTWVRAGKTHGGRMHDHWRCVDGEHVGYWANWDRLAAVRVLSEGVQP